MHSTGCSGIKNEKQIEVTKHKNTREKPCVFFCAFSPPREFFAFLLSFPLLFFSGGKQNIVEDEPIAG